MFGYTSLDVIFQSRLRQKGSDEVGIEYEVLKMDKKLFEEGKRVYPDDRKRQKKWYIEKMHDYRVSKYTLFTFDELLKKLFSNFPDFQK